MLNKTNMNKKYLVAIVIAGATLVSACNSGGIRRNPGRIYAPDMVYSQAYDAYTENPVTRNGLTSQLPVPGTIDRAQPLPKHLTETDMQGYFDLKFPKLYSGAEIDEGKRLFDIYCAICHGENLDGQGPLFTSGKFASMPANLVAGDYYLNLAPGMIYHTIEYGKNMMGSYYSQLDEQQRWEVIAYVKKMQDDKKGVPSPFLAGADSTAVVPNAAGSDSSKSASAAVNTTEEKKAGA